MFRGGPGKDTYIFADGWGLDTIVDTNENGTWDFSGVTSNLAIVENQSGILQSVTAGSNSLNLSGGASVNRVIGGTGMDTVSLLAEFINSNDWFIVDYNVVVLREP